MRCSLLILVVHVFDQARAKADRNRQRVQEIALRQTHQLRVEQAQAKRDLKRRLQKERILKVNILNMFSLSEFYILLGLSPVVYQFCSECYFHQPVVRGGREEQSVVPANISTLMLCNKFSTIMLAWK